jgi:hypothetical protein
MRFKKQYKPIKFGDRAAQDEAKRLGLLSGVIRFSSSELRRY